MNRKPLLVVLLAVCAFVALFTLMQFRLYDAFRMGLRDLAFFQQSFESALHGKPFLIRQGYPADTAVSHLFYTGWDERSLFSEHLYLFSILFLPLYAVFRTPYLFLALNAVGVGLTAVPLFLLAKQWLRGEWLAVVVACAFLLHPAVQVATLGDYIYGMHPDDFMPLLTLGALVCATRVRPRAFWLLSLLALATVESVAPTVAALGVYMSFSVPHWRRHGIALAVVAVLYFGIATLVIIPLAGGGRAPYYFAALQTLSAAILHPELLLPLWQATLDLGSAVLVPLAGLPLLAGPLWLIALPQLLSGIAAQTVGYPIPMEYGSWHGWPYGLAAFLGLIKALAWVERRHSRALTAASLGLLGAGALAGIVLFGPYPFSRNVWPQAYDVDLAKEKFVAQLAEEIPNDVSLSVEFFLGSHFAGRPDVKWFPVDWRNAQYVLVDPGAWAWWSEDDSRALRLVQRSAYVTLIAQADQVALFRHQSMPVLEQSSSESFANGIELNGYTVEPRTLAAGTPVTLTLFWRAKRAIPQDLTVFVHVVGADGKIVTQRDSQPDNGAYSTSQWPAGEQIWDRRVIPLPANAAPGSYEFEIGLYDAATGRRSELVTGQDHLRLGSLMVRPQ